MIIIKTAFVLLIIILFGSTLYISLEILIIEKVPLEANKKADKKADKKLKKGAK